MLWEELAVPLEELVSEEEAPEEDVLPAELLWEELELPEDELEELAAPAMVSSSVLLVTVLSL